MYETSPTAAATAGDEPAATCIAFMERTGETDLFDDAIIAKAVASVPSKLTTNSEEDRVQIYETCPNAAGNEPVDTCIAFMERTGETDLFDDAIIDKSKLQESCDTTFPPP